jgi:hypothetical protein
VVSLEDWYYIADSGLGPAVGVHNVSPLLIGYLWILGRPGLPKDDVQASLLHLLYRLLTHLSDLPAFAMLLLLIRLCWP